MGNTQHLQSVSVAYTDQGLTVPYSHASNQQLQLFSASVLNGTSAENEVGLFHSISNPHVKMFQLLAAADVEKTSEIQAGTATTIFTTSNNDGVLFQSKEKFHMIAFNVSQAQTGTPVFTYKYYNGSGYSTLNLLNTPDYSATGIQVAVFNAPIDWVTGDGVEDGDDTFYSIQVIATTAPTQAIKIDSLKLGKMLKYAEIHSGASLEIEFEDEPYLLQVGETIIPFFSYANASNRIDINYKTM